MPNHVLIVTVWSEPQVVTLVLDSLLAQKIAIKEVVAVHTTPNAPPVQQALGRLNDVFYEQKYYGSDIDYRSYVFTSAKGALEDAVTPQQIESVFNNMYLLMRQYKQQGDIIHLGIAGGRKTMALLAMSVAQALFESRDHVWHLVSSPEVLNSKTMHTKEGVTLIDMPFRAHEWANAKEIEQAKTFFRYVLSEAERQVVRLLLEEGLNNAHISERLVKSKKTVANQLTSIYEKCQEFYALSYPPDRVVFIIMLGKYQNLLSQTS